MVGGTELAKPWSNDCYKQIIRLGTLSFMYNIGPTLAGGCEQMMHSLQWLGTLMVGTRLVCLKGGAPNVGFHVLVSF